MDRPFNRTSGASTADLPVSLVTALKTGTLTAVPVCAATTAFYFCGLFMPKATLPNWRLPDPWNAIVGGLDIFVLSPVVETAFMLLPIRMLQLMRVNQRLIPIFSAAIWALLHARGGDLIALVNAWPFFWFTVLFIAAERVSVNRAWLLVSLAHMLHNAIMHLFECIMVGIVSR